MKTKNRTLSKIEARLILDLEWHGKHIVHLKEIQSLLDVSKGHARFIAFKLVHNGWLERLRGGVFQLIPAERGLEAISDTSPFLATDVFQNPTFYSFGTACSFYGFTDQVFAEIFLASSKSRTPQHIRGKKYVFALVPRARFLAYQKVKAFGQPVQMATPERAVLDALERPRYAGDLAEVSRIIRVAWPKLDLGKLLDLLQIWKQSALVQRLGFFIDLHGIQIPPKFRAHLKKLVRSNNKIYLTTQGRWNTSTHLNSEWLIIENIPKSILLEGTENKRPYVPRKVLTTAGNEESQK